MLSAGISPACQFISGGKNFIEICSTDGTIKKIAVPADNAPLKEPAKGKQSNHLKNNCAFCFSQSHQKVNALPVKSLQIVYNSKYLPSGSGSFIFKSQKQSQFEARAPPATFS